MIQLQNIHCTFNAGTPLEVRALKNISIDIHQGEYVMVVGSNGSGKSTLLNLLSGTATPNSGKILLKSKDITGLPDYKRSPMIARVFQDPLQGSSGELTILENFRLAALRTGRRNLTFGTNAAFRKIVQQEISRLNLGLENNPERLMGSLSGGQRQALTLLMAVMSPCELLLMDEPASALDPKTARMLMQIADDLIRQHQITTIHITHQMKDAAEYGNRLLMMEDGQIIKDFSGELKNKITTKELFEWFV
jgi:putative ABC transport system ATP-binding protein